MALGGQRGGAGAVDEALGIGPAQGVGRPGADLLGIAELVQRRPVCGVIALVLGIAVQNDSHLLPGDGVVGAEPSVMIAADDAMVRSSVDRVAVPVIRRHIAERITQVLLRQTGTVLQPVQYGH